jgi:hypothetical protein
LLDVPHIYIQHFSYHLLELLLVGHAFRGILITVDRPANYIIKLMDNRGLSVDNLGIIDVVTSISTGAVEAPTNTKILKSPFCIDIHREIHGCLEAGEVTPGGGGLDTINFIMFDNVAVLDHYIEILCLKRIFVQMEQIATKNPHLKIVITLDCARNKKIFKALEGWADVIIQRD